jgi:hypothetical protein
MSNLSFKVNMGRPVPIQPRRAPVFIGLIVAFGIGFAIWAIIIFIAHKLFGIPAP